RGRGPPPPLPPRPRPRRRWAPRGAGRAATVDDACSRSASRRPDPDRARLLGTGLLAEAAADTPLGVEEGRLLRTHQLHGCRAERTDVSAEPAHALAVPGKTRLPV